MTAASVAPDRADLRRAVLVAVAAVVAVVGAFLGSGAVVGTPIQEAAGGALDADSTLLAPGTGAFRIWSVIYVGLLALAVWQLLPRVRRGARQRRVGWLVAASMLLNAAWILSVQADLLWASLPIIVALLAVLVVVFRRLLAERGSGVAEAIVVDGTMGLYLGWVSVATVANATAVLQAAGVDAGGASEAVAVVVLLVVLGVATLLAVVGRGRLAPAAAIAWGVAWIGVARSTDAPESVVVAAAAFAVAALTVVVTLVARLRAGRGPVG